MDRRGCNLVLLLVDQRLAVKIIERLRKRGVNSSLLEFPKVDIIITDSKAVASMKSKEGKKVILVSNEDYEGKVELFLLQLRGKMLYNELLVGVDPGENIGFIIIGDGKIIEWATYNVVDRLMNRLENIILYYPYRNCVIRVGNRGRNAEKILDEIVNLMSKIRALGRIIVEVVDESKTRRTFHPSIRGLPKDVTSALIIAYRKGIEVRCKQVE